MAIQLRTTLKGYFQTGNIPVEQHYVDIIDSTLNISESNSGNIDLTGNISMSGNISSSGITGTHTLGGDVFITGILSSSGEISSSGAFTGSGINILGDITASGNIKCGELALGGELAAVNTDFNYISGSRLTLGTGEAQLSLGGTILTTTFAELNYLDGLTSGEATQIKNIGSSTISSTQWGYLGAMDQSITQTSVVQFAGINLTKAGIAAGNFGDTIATEGQSFKLTINNIPEIPGKASGKISKTAINIVTNDSVTANSVINISSTSDLSATAFRVASGTFYFSIANESPVDFTDGSAVFNFTIF